MQTAGILAAQAGKANALAGFPGGRRAAFIARFTAPAVEAGFLCWRHRT